MIDRIKAFFANAVLRVRVWDFPLNPFYSPSLAFVVKHRKVLEDINTVLMETIPEVVAYFREVAEVASRTIGAIGIEMAESPEVMAALQKLATVNLLPEGVGEDDGSNQ